MKALKYIVIISVIFLSWAQAFACATEEANYHQLINGLPLDCGADKDCETQDLAWDVCQGSIPFLKGSLDAPSIGAVKAARREFQKKCGYVPKPCAAVPAPKAYCFKDKCDLMVAYAERAPTFPVVLVNSKTSEKLKNLEVALKTQQTIYCAMAPCPQPPSRNHNLKSDANGLLTLRSDDLGQDNYFSVKGFTPQSFRHDHLLALKGRKIGFEPQ